MSSDPFRVAARAYLVYGIVYWIGGIYLVMHGVGVGGSGSGRAVASILLGTMFLIFIPMLLARPRPWFERHVLSRRNFARVLVVFMLVRAYKVGQVASRSDTATVAAPWGGEITYRAGAAVFLVITVAALILIARAAWWTPPPAPAGPTASAPEPWHYEPPPPPSGAAPLLRIKPLPSRPSRDRDDNRAGSPS
jgi:hypothetical protein